jgi:hypothetical protein
VKLSFFDANLFVGLPMKGVYGPARDGVELEKLLSHCGIERAVPWHIAQYDYHPRIGNQLIAEMVGRSSHLYGCWTILPSITRELPSPDVLFSEMKLNRIGALRIFPEQGRFLMNRLVMGDLLQGAAERRIPILLSPERGAPWPAIVSLLEQFPTLTCILCDIGEWSMDRQTWPLLEAYPNVCLETSLLSFQAGGVEATVQRFGGNRLIFGSGFPVRSPEASMLQLTHAEISDRDKVSIACGNLESLIARVV